MYQLLHIVIVTAQIEEKLFAHRRISHSASEESKPALASLQYNGLEHASPPLASSIAHPQPMKEANDKVANVHLSPDDESEVKVESAASAGAAGCMIPYPREGYS